MTNPDTLAGGVKLNKKALEAAASLLPHVWPGGFEDQTEKPLGYRPNRLARDVAANLISAYLAALPATGAPEPSEATVKTLIGALTPFAAVADVIGMDVLFDDDYQPMGQDILPHLSDYRRARRALTAALSGGAK